MVATEATMSLVGISKYYSGVAALMDVSFDVRPGEVHALLGENGAGKSTLMNVASGTTQPDTGTITISGQTLEELTPSLASSLGIAIVHQHPAVLPDLTVAENIRLAVPSRFLDGTGSRREAMQAMLDDVGSSAHLEDRVGSLSIAQKHLLELAKALVMKPKVLILDEPTAPLGQDSVQLLFDRVRTAAAAGTAIVYITHRLAEVRELADRVTVLRDGKYRGTMEVAAITDDELLTLIVGRQLESTFPPKHHSTEGTGTYLSIARLTGPGFADISVQAQTGEIVGVAGVVGNGQSDLMAALAGLAKFEGSITVHSQERSAKDLRERAAYMPADRHREGLMMTLSVRENAAVVALQRFVRSFFMSSKEEVSTVGRELTELSVKAPNMDANVASLSGGNQQKVVMARALLSEPALVVADEPTQGVDVGARAEIYRILREVAEDGTPVVVNSSDAKELEGLCDRVIVMSRGRVVAELVGEEVTEARIVAAAVSATAHGSADAQQVKTTTRRSTRLSRFLQGDYSPVAILAIVMLALGAYVFSQNDRYLTAFNTTAIQGLVAALGFIAMGQTIALMTGGIDLSVGPLSGFLVVIASFFIGVDSAFGQIALGFILMLLAAVITGGLNGFLIRYGRFTPVAATLAVYIGLQGLSYVLRDGPEGIINADVMALIKTKVGPIPVAFIALVIFAFLLEGALRYTRWGLTLRAVGSDEEAARRVGVHVNRTVLLAYLSVSLCVFLGAILLMAQIGIGDPSQGANFTLTSITAVVLGGTSLLGGRGTFIGTLLGAGLIIQVLNATTFLGLDQWSTYFFQGILIVIAAIVYSQVRGRRAVV
ncbi:MAG: ATP-binding cassette domain-containing protein [Actinomycetales bacterium]|nr:ATP-binding cassette domain-containing protein [Actinomycetales bacterium]